MRRPGIVIVPAGSRVTDALAAAGGVPRHRVLGGLNLAAVLVDGQQIVVGAAAPSAGDAVTGSTSTAGAGSGTADQPAAGALVNLNTATGDQLDTLPGVGPVTAQAILEWREQNGGFTSVQELLEVDGIGPATLAKLTPGPSRMIQVPRVAESPVSFECRLSEIVRLKGHDGTAVDSWLVLGEVVGVHIADAMLDNGIYQTARARPIMRAGGPTSYYEISANAEFHMSRPQAPAT